MNKRWIWNISRFFIVAAIFFYLYKNDLFEPAKLTKAIERIDLFIAAILLILFSSFIAAQRWRFLLIIQNISIGLWLTIKLTFIGFFFSTALPGAVSGDIIKAYYITKGEQQKEVLITSILFDRLLGLYTMILVAVLTLLFSSIYDKLLGQQGIWPQPYMKELGIFILSLFLFLTILGKLFMSKSAKSSSFIERNLLKLPFNKTIIKVYDSVHHYGKKPGLTFQAIILSIVAQIPLFAGLWCIAILLNINEMTILDYLIALPVCLLLNAIPLAPGGLGVGEAGFREIFLLFGSHEGAELAFLFHVIFFILAIGLGGLVYLFSDISIKNEKAVEIT